MSLLFDHIYANYGLSLTDREISEIRRVALVDIEQDKANEPAKDIRDEFAAAVMGGMCANPSAGASFPTAEGGAAHAYKLADAMIKARKEVGQ